MKIFLLLVLLVAADTGDPCSPGSNPPLCDNGPSTDPIPWCLEQPPVCALGVDPGAECSAPLTQACD